MLLIIIHAIIKEFIPDIPIVRGNFPDNKWLADRRENMKCPHCNKNTSDSGKICVHCGKAIKKPIERDSHKTIVCPHCKTNAEITYLAGVELDYCPQCSGIWFDRGESKNFQNVMQDPKILSEFKSELENFSVACLKTSRSDYLNCPVCSKHMLHKKFIEVSDIIIDKCADHGAWIEQDDLLKIIEIISSGKIDELIARATYEQQKKIDERIRKIEGIQSTFQNEILKERTFSRVHFILDLLGFT